ncbi:MAG TPA: hypothetical protein VKA51_13085 [Rubrobacteraceae bacterium]|nr:hypothetical protein [Rubrobacteraceae bacterium]
MGERRSGGDQEGSKDFGRAEVLAERRDPVTPTTTGSTVATVAACPASSLFSPNV